MWSNGDADIEQWEAEGGSAREDEQEESPARAARYADHTSEIELELRAPTMKGLFVQAGESLAELILGEDHEPPERAAAPETVTLEAADTAALLVTWLEELIYRADTDHEAFTRFQITSLDDRRLSATLLDPAPLDRDNPIKAATYHGLRVDRDTDGSFSATVVLDV